MDRRGNFGKITAFIQPQCAASPQGVRVKWVNERLEARIFYILICSWGTCWCLLFFMQLLFKHQIVWMKFTFFYLQMQSYNSARVTLLYWFQKSSVPFAEFHCCRFHWWPCPLHHGVRITPVLIKAGAYTPCSVEFLRLLRCQPLMINS